MFRLPKSSSDESPLKEAMGVSSKNVVTCKYRHRTCNLLCLENYDYCLKHILEDKSAPYKPCPFLYTVSGKKCSKPAYRSDRKDTWFCPEHSRKTQLLQQKAKVRHAPPQTPEALLASLSHYARTHEPVSDTKKEDNEHEESAAKESSQAINPFVEVDAAKVNSRFSQILNYASDSDSDVEGAMVDNVWRALDHESSDAESIDSQGEDPLKHAGVFTAEEATIVIKDKMIRLQSLYIDQFRRLHHLLKERRRKYLHDIKKEKETLSSIHDQEKTSTKEQKLYQKLKALNHFHKYYGEEAVLHKKALERRAQVTEGTLVRTSHKGKCSFTEGGVKCGAKTIPGTKYCQKHILEDTQQVLFRACGFKRDDHICQEPTLNVFENATCVYHVTLPAQPHNSLDICEMKEDNRTERGIDQKSQEDAVTETQSDTVDKPNLTAEEDILKPLEPVISTSKTTELVSPILKSKDLSSPTPNIVASASSNEPINPAIENVGDVAMAEPVCEGNKIVDEKMEVDNALENISTSAEQSKHNNSTGDDLVMVDMMTDVGVVEEVLDSEIKTPEQSMQVGMENDITSPGNG